MIARVSQPTILVIVGISGDLSKRKLLPAIHRISRAGLLPEHFKIVGVTRRNLTKADVLPHGKNADLDKMVELYHMDLADPAAYHKLAEHLESIERHFKTKAQHLFYLSVPPQITRQVVTMLGHAGLFEYSGSKLLLEKPFGTDLESAEELVQYLSTHCAEDQIYRIDHYLAKEMAQNLLVLRTGNALFGQTWNKDFIESIEIVAAEEIGIEGRTAFYEQTGALRDFIQSHLLQMAALVLMELPADGSRENIPKERLKALEALDPPTDITADVTRGQYVGYRAEVGVADSTVETFVRLRLSSRDPRWEGVPITLTTGKAMDTKTTEVRVRYRSHGTAQSNELVLRVQPNEGLTLNIWVKRPGYEHAVQPLPLVLNYENHFTENDLPDAYERVFVDAMRNDHALFTTSAEVLASWRILAPIQHAWSMQSDDLVFYDPGHSPIV